MLSIRKARPEDIEHFKQVVTDSIVGLCRDYYTSTQIAALLEQYPEPSVYKKWLEQRILFVAEIDSDGGKIVGFAQYYPPNGSIEAMHVAPAYTKRGIGKMLLSAIEDQAKATKAKHITLDSSLNAVGFYQKYGYHRTQEGTFRCNNGINIKVVGFEKKL